MNVIFKNLSLLFFLVNLLTNTVIVLFVSLISFTFFLTRHHVNVTRNIALIWALILSTYYNIIPSSNFYKMVELKLTWLDVTKYYCHTRRGHEVNFGNNHVNKVKGSEVPTKLWLCSYIIFIQTGDSFMLISGEFIQIPSLEFSTYHLWQVWHLVNSRRDTMNNLFFYYWFYQIFHDIIWFNIFCTSEYSYVG